MKKKFLYFFQIFFTILILIPNQSLADSNTITSDSSTQQDIDGDGEFLTVKDNSTLATGATTKAANVTGDSVDVTVESGSTISANTVAVFGNNTSDLTVTNSGTITASGTNAIDVRGTTDATITNSSGGTISSNRNTIRISKTGSNNTTGMTITNSGTITASSGSAIFASDGNSTATITNKIGGEITNSDTSNATIRAGASSTIVNSGTIKNDIDNDAIKLYGNNATITLKDGGIVVGKIDGLLRTGSKLKFNHGVGQGYFYETEGDFTLEDLDGNQVVQGSAGSVGQGASETQDELLGYKSLNIRKSLNRYKKNKNKLNENEGWGETFGSLIKRNQNDTSLSLGYSFINLGVNIIYPLEKSDHILFFETGRQKFKRDHDINHLGFLSGINFSNIDSETFILGGVTLHESKRTILTNTTTTGTLDVEDNYYSVKALTGTKFKSKKLIPDFGFTASGSITPNHSESKYYTWNTKSILNLSTYIEDEYNFNIKNEKNNLNLGWNIDLRKLVVGDEQDYKINGTKATYTQDNDLTEEVVFSANVEFLKKISNSEKLSFGLDGFLSTQEAGGFQASINYIMKL